MATLQLQLRVGSRDIGPHWLAFEQRLGIAVFADSRDAAETRLRSAVDFTLGNIDDGTSEGRQSLFNYLEKHGVEYSVEDGTLAESPIPDMDWSPPIVHEAVLPSVS